MSYILDTENAISMPMSAENSVTEELLSNYTYGRKWNVAYNAQGNCITVGNYTKADYGDSEYVINVTDDGVYIEGREFPSTMRGFMTFLERIKYSVDDGSFYIENCCITENPLMSFR